MADFLKGLFSEDNGNSSMMRVVVAVVVFVIVGTWSQHCILSGELVGFDYEEVALLIGLMGVKAYQKGKEA